MLKSSMAYVRDIKLCLPFLTLSGLWTSAESLFNLDPSRPPARRIEATRRIEVLELFCVGIDPSRAMENMPPPDLLPGGADATSGSLSLSWFRSWVMRSWQTAILTGWVCKSCLEDGGSIKQAQQGGGIISIATQWAVKTSSIFYPAFPASSGQISASSRPLPYVISCDRRANHSGIGVADSIGALWVSSVGVMGRRSQTCI
jgi:hypothetical protein